MSLNRAISFAAGFLASITLLGQNASFEYYLSTRPLLQSDNAAALSTSTLKSISDVNASFRKDKGAFIGVDGSKDSWMAKAGGESYTRISDRIVFYGRLSYSYFSGKEMGGSLLIDRDYYPFSFEESTSETLGGKKRELYGLAGAMSYSINKKWSLGVRMDYEAGNNVKIKDPRYRSEWMLLNLSAGMFCKTDNGLSLGASAIYKSTKEKVMTHVYGITGVPYYVLIDRGLFFGINELVEGSAGSDGFLSTSEFKPAVYDFYGASFQLESAGRTRSYNQIKVLYKTGKYGKGTSSDPIFFEYSGIEASYDGKLFIEADKNMHDVHYCLSFASLNNAENSIKYTTPNGQNTIVEYIGRNPVQQRYDFDANLGYRMVVDADAPRPKMEFGADINAGGRITDVSIYPYTRKQSVVKADANAYYRQNFCLDRNIITVDANAGYGMGMGNTLRNDPDPKKSTLKSQDEYLNRQFEYDTIGRVNLGAGLTYTRLLNDRISIYINIKDVYTRALGETVFLGSPNRNSMVLTIGCTL